MDDRPEIHSYQPGPDSILVEGKTCWRKRRSGRASFLIDAACYFEAFVRTVEKARRTVYIAGWDMNSRVSLIRDTEDAARKYRLDKFLSRMISEKPGLKIYILVWDFAMIFALDREILPVFRVGWDDRGLHYHMDDEHPVGASHHQKVVVVDDRVAFAGGVDLTRNRWDTPEHKAEDDRRVDPMGRPYPPFHDVHMAVDGDAAASLGDLFRARWKRATGEELSPPEPVESDPWPENITPDLSDVDVAIARTQAEYKSYPEIREVEALHRAAIASARQHIYIENQYLTSNAVEDALKEKLCEDDGPEIVILVPLTSSGWLEETTMDIGRAFMVKRLRHADRRGRLKVYYPVVDGVDPTAMTLHSKALIVDDRLVRVGSSNMSNRSMGLDTECDLAVEALDSERIGNAIARFRNQLLAEHLGASPDEIRGMLERRGSLIDTVEALRGGRRSLEPLHVDIPKWLEEIAPESNPADPERPIDPEKLLDSLIPQDEARSNRKPYIEVGSAILVVALLAAAWQWGPLGDWIDKATLAAWAKGIKAYPMAPLYLIAAFVVGGFLMAPVTLLIVATALAFSPSQAALWSFCGAMASAVALFGAGRFIGRRSVRKLAGSAANRISQRLAEKGVITVVMLRLVPIAPYTIANLVMGATHIKWRDFIVGTMVGIAPGIVAISYLSGTLTDIVSSSDKGDLVFVAVGALILVAVLIGVTRLLSGNTTESG